MKTLKQAVSVNGTVLSNKDPDMVIKLDSHPGVQISSIQEDSITYTFNGEVPQDTLYSLNLTFTYKGKHKCVVPLSLTHKHIEVTTELHVTWITTDADLVGAKDNRLHFSVTDETGAPAKGVTLKSLDFVTSPNSPMVSPGYFNNLNENATDYDVGVKLGHRPGKVTANMTLTYKGNDFVIPAKAFNSPGTQMAASLDTTKLLTTDNETDVVITFTQNQYDKLAGPLTVTMSKLTVTGGGSTSTVPPINTNAQGQVTIKVAPSGELKDIVVAGEVTEVGGGYARAFSQTISVEAGAVVTTEPMVIYDKDGPQKVTLNVKVLDENMDGTLGALTVTGNATVAERAPLQIAGGKVEITLTPTTGVGPVNISGTVLNRLGQPVGDFQLVVQVELTPEFSISGPANSISLKVGEQKTLYYYAHMNGQPAAKRIGIDEPTSSVPRSATIIKRSAEDDEVYAVVVEGNSNNSYGPLKFNWVVDGSDPNGPLNRMRGETSVTVLCLGYLGVKAVTPQVYVKTGDTVKVGLSLVIDNDEALPMSTEGIVITTDNPDEVEILGNVADGFNIKSLWVPDQGMNTRTTNFTVTYLGLSVPFSVKVSHQSTNPSPTSEVTGKIVGVGGDTGKMPVKITSRMTPDLDLTDAAVEWSVTTNDYISVSPEGVWTIKKDPETTASGTLRFSFRIPEQSMKWSDDVQVDYTIGNSTGPQITDLTNKYEMDLWDVAPLVFSIKAEGVDVTSELTDIVCVNASEIAAQFEFVKISDTSWGFKAIKADPVKWQSNYGSLVFKVTHDGKNFELPAQVELSTRPNTNGIETQRFKVEAV